jgi:hypothetical protein
MRPQINPADAKPGPDDALGRFFPIASPRDPAAHARLLALRGAETNFCVRNCRRFHLKALDHLVLLIVFLLRAVAVAAIQPRRNWDEQQGP